ncbi:sprT domain-containing protein [Pseudopedobacter sp.]|uniref:sprT domain-containing protein n=1 Tax=Pseudopedobacter sp. TaxID=1936787 RepID=UPI0033419F56
MEDRKVKILTEYMPEKAALLIAEWIDKYKCEFKITKSRESKFGDYRAPYQGAGHRISVNHNLNRYAFLITTVHEFAHLLTYNQWKSRVKPHGTEWKNNFKRMMIPFFEMTIFPLDIEKALAKYLKNPAASSCTDQGLFSVLKKYDVKQDSEYVNISEITENQIFEIKTGRKFKKLTRNRTRYKCLEISTGKIYLFSPLAEVKAIS